MALNTWLLRVSGGRLGRQLGAQTILLLHTIGRKSGQTRVIPIAYFGHQGRYLIVASNWGRDKQADWYLNLKHTPQATLEINGARIPVLAREAEGAEYEQLWQYVTRKHPPYLEYQAGTTRRIPIMVFEPASAGRPGQAVVA